MATQFLLQMEQASSAVGVEPGADGAAAGDEGSQDLGLGGQTGSLVAGSLGLGPNGLPLSAAASGQPALSPKVAAQLARVLGAGGEAALSALLTGGGRSAPLPAADAGAGAGLLNAPVGGGASSASARQNALVVAREARRAGVDPAVAVAMMLVESGGNNRAVGDGGTSFGLFQLHQGGMLTAARLTPQQAFDPATNAGVALRSLAHEWRKGPNRSPGVIAAASQRPADPVGYAAKVQAALPRAQALLDGG